MSRTTGARFVRRRRGGADVPKRRSIYRRWLAVSLLAAFVVFAALAAVVSYLVQREFYAQSLREMTARAETIASAYAGLQSGESTPAEIRKLLGRIEREDRLTVSVVGRRGTKALKLLVPEVGARPDVRSWVQSVAEGERIEVIAKYRRQDDEKMLIVGMPLIWEGEVAASVYLYKPVSDARELAKPIRRSIWLAALLCAGPFALLLRLAVRRMAGPIRAMEEAAAAIAAGDFTMRVEVPDREDEIARLGRSFNAMAERLARIEEQRSRLLMELSHDLRTPLTSIGGTLQAISDGLLAGEELKEYADLSLAESKRLARLVDQIQELSAFEEHSVVFAFEPTELRELAEALCRQNAPAAEARRMTIGVRLPAEPLRVRADPMRLRQALSNLVGNAIEHNDSGTRIVIAVRREGRRALLSVSDDGRGIAPEHLPRLFERLYKADSSRGSRGSGLGLTIARHIVLAHGGTIEARSEPGRGAEFVVFLPLLRP